MALEAVVFSQAGAGHFGYGRVDSPYAMPWCDLPGATGFGFAGDWGYDGLLASVAPDGADEWETASAKQDQSSEASAVGKGTAEPAAAAGRRKRRRAKVVKNKEEIETQRMTHIAVERNRRRQMNEHLAVLRSLMPPSYAHRGDQASIVGGAINYVRELEQLLQSLEVQKSIKNRDAGCSCTGCTDAAGKSPFAGFFTFPQYSTSSSHAGCAAAATSSNNTSNVANGEAAGSGASGDRAPAVADIEVTMVEGHASLKVLVPRRPKQLLKLVAGLQHLRVPPLHLNVTSVDAMVLYTFSLKVEDDSKMGSVDDIATAVHEILSRIRRQEVEEETAVM